MSITKPTTSTFKAGTKFDNVSADNYFMEPIATTLVGAGGSASISFNSIPQGYQHLQIRGILKNTGGTTEGALFTRLNGDTGSNYSAHRLAGNGSIAYAQPATSQPYIANYPVPNSQFAGWVMDILDYTNQNKYKTVRQLMGGDYNGSGTVAFASGLWMNTAPITSITFTLDAGNFIQYSRLSLYGLRG